MAISCDSTSEGAPTQAILDRHSVDDAAKQRPTPLPELKAAAAMKAQRPSVLIVAPDAGAWFQPLIRSMVRSLCADFDIQMLGLERHAQHARAHTEAQIHLMPRRPGTLRAIIDGCYVTLLAIFARLFLPKISFSRASIPKLWETSQLAAGIRRHKADHVIAIDTAAAFASQLAKRSCHLFHLEIYRNDLAYLALRRGTILNVITQNKLRYLTAFVGTDIPYFFVPNFPTFKKRTLSEKQEAYVFAGSGLPGFGSVHCLKYAAQYADVRLAYRGNLPQSFLDLVHSDKYAGLLRTGRVQIEHQFQEEDDYVESLSAFQIGFAFYDLMDADREFMAIGEGIGNGSIENYLTGAAGKAGYCCAAGVPLIASALPGLSFIAEYGVGILINDHRPETIRAAATQILANHAAYRANCFELAKTYSFENHFKPFKDLLLSRN